MLGTPQKLMCGLCFLEKVQLLGAMARKQFSANRAVKKLLTIVSRGLYHLSITDAKTYYKSHDYKDEIVWACLWVHMASPASSDLLDECIRKYDSFRLHYVATEFSWSLKTAGVQVCNIGNNSLFSSRKISFFKWESSNGFLAALWHVKKSQYLGKGFQRLAAAIVTFVHRLDGTLNRHLNFYHK